MLRTMSRVGVTWILCCAMTAAGQSQSSTTPPPETKRFALNIDNSRPLANAADALQQKFGISISYEDILWVNRSDLMPAGEFPSPNNKRLKNPDLLVPALARVDIDIDIDAKTLVPTRTPKATLEELVNQHTGRRNPGEFKVLGLANDAGFSIVPSRSKNAQGVVGNAISPLDARINLPTQERSGDSTVFCDKSDHNLFQGIVKQSR
jgi:hypothetical protein